MGVASLSLVSMGPNWLVLFGILSFTVAGGNSITLEEILEEIESLKYVVRELSARIEACDSQNKQQDITIEHNADSASTERDILTTRVHDNAIGLAENIQRAVDLRKDLSELQNGTQTGLNQLNETLTEELTKTQDKLTRTQDVLIPGVSAIIPWIPSPFPGEMDATIPSGWQRCDGSNITEGPFAGLKTPNLNGERYFLRGGDDSTVTTTEKDMVQDHTHDVDDSGHSHSTSYDGAKETGLDVALYDKNVNAKSEANVNGRCLETQGSDCTNWYYDTANSHSHTVNRADSGINVGSVSSSYNKGSETRPKKHGSHLYHEDLLDTEVSNEFNFLIKL